MLGFSVKIKYNSGFTLIEMLVALSLFTIVVTIAVGAFLSLIGASKTVQNEQSVITTLTFVLDSMSREIRTGTAYNCSAGSFSNQESLGTAVSDCASSHSGISFIESGSSITGSSANRIAYYYTGDSIMRRVGNGAAQSIVSEGINLTHVHFYVTGSQSLDSGTNINQPTVTITIEAEDEDGNQARMQSTVTQRELDI